MAEKNQIGTALVAAYIRGYHAIHDTPKIFNDFLANRFLSEKERILIEKQFIKLHQSAIPAGAPSFPDQEATLSWFMQSIAGSPLILARSRYAEDLLAEAVRQGVQQYVILGAGMDTFAYRQPEMLEQIRVFEVDHPATQAFKRSRLEELGWEQPAQLHFVAMDFIKENPAEALEHSGYDPQAPSFFSWLGVTFYLPREPVFNTFQAMARVAPAGSMIVFDYLDADAFVPEKAAIRVKGMLGLAQQGGGVPMQTGFEPSTLAEDLAHLGLHLHQDLCPFDIQERYFRERTDNYYACEHVHYACAMVKPGRENYE